MLDPTIANALAKVKEMGYTAFVLFCYLVSIADQNGKCSPGYKEIAAATGLSTRPIANGLRMLATAGLIEYNHSFRTYSEIVILYNIQYIVPLINSNSIYCIPVQSKGLQDNEVTLGPLSSAVVEATHLPELTGGPQRWIEAIQKMQAAGVIPEDVHNGVAYLKSKGMSITSAQSVVNSAIISMGNRKRKIDTLQQNENFDPTNEADLFRRYNEVPTEIHE